MKRGQRVSYERNGEVRHGIIVGIDRRTSGGPYYIVLNDASRMYHTVHPSNVIR
jgi:hypothetical protein